MYEAYWRLRSKPFEEIDDARACFPVEAQQAAILKLRYAIENRRPAALLTGDTGTGKSLMLGVLESQLPETIAPRARIIYPRLSSQELLSAVSAELTGETPASELSLERLVQQIHHSLRENAEAGRHAVVIIDEAQLLKAPGGWDSLRLLLNVQHGKGSALTLILSAQTSVLPLLSRMPAWEDRLAVKCLLRPFSAEESAAYIRHRLFAAGAERDIFEPEALAAMHAICGGSPRRLNRVGDLALLIAFAEDSQSIRAHHIDAVSEELLLCAA